jgi:hypothetical protein
MPISNLVKQGNWVTTRINGKDFKYLSHFTSIEYACHKFLCVGTCKTAETASRSAPQQATA